MTSQCRNSPNFEKVEYLQLQFDHWTRICSSVAYPVCLHYTKLDETTDYKNALVLKLLTLQKGTRSLEKASVMLNQRGAEYRWQSTWWHFLICIIDQSFFVTMKKAIAKQPVFTLYVLTTLVVIKKKSVPNCIFPCNKSHLVIKYMVTTLSMTKQPVFTSASVKNKK